jgi:hypothetical protein
MLRRQVGSVGACFLDAHAPGPFAVRMAWPTLAGMRVAIPPWREPREVLPIKHEPIRSSRARKRLSRLRPAAGVSAAGLCAVAGFVDVDQTAFRRMQAAVEIVLEAPATNRSTPRFGRRDWRIEPVKMNRPQYLAAEHQCAIQAPQRNAD